MPGSTSRRRPGRQGSRGNFFSLMYLGISSSFGLTQLVIHICCPFLRRNADAACRSALTSGFVHAIPSTWFCVIGPYYFLDYHPWCNNMVCDQSKTHAAAWRGRNMRVLQTNRIQKTWRSCCLLVAVGALSLVLSFQPFWLVRKSEHKPADVRKACCACLYAWRELANVENKVFNVKPVGRFFLPGNNTLPQNCRCCPPEPVRQNGELPGGRTFQRPIPRIDKNACAFVMSCPGAANLANISVNLAHRRETALLPMQARVVLRI